jgi:conjugal transfer ATP-binding protein TraC
MFYEKLMNFVGPYPGVTKSELNNLSYRSSFSKYLPWHSYDDETGIYYNNDDTISFMYECIPHNFSNESTIESLDGIFKLGLPKKTVIQFIMYGDEYIDPILEQYRSLTDRDLPELVHAKDKMIEFLKSGTKGLDHINDTPVRRFRLMVSIKFPLESLNEKGFDLNRVKRGVKETLFGAQLHPKEVLPSELLFIARHFFNGKILHDHYNKKIPINKQIILSDNEIKVSPEEIEMGGRTFQCITPKVYPEYLDPLKLNKILGGIDGETSNNSQILTPFMVSISIVTDELRKGFHTKSALLNAQNKSGTSGSAIAKRQNEYAWAVSLVDDNKQFCHIMTSIWVWGEEKSRVEESLHRLMRLWTAEGFTMQQDTKILPVMLISSLPFGLYAKDKKQLDLISRSFVVPETSAVGSLMTQADYIGNGICAVPFIGRKGQLISLDIASPNATNKNGFVVAGSGGGKSFLVNFLVANYYASGAKIRIVDIGFSYKKAAAIFGGKFLDFNSEGNICMNPFGQILEGDDDKKSESIIFVAEIIGQMVYSAQLGEHRLTPDESTILKNVVKTVYQSHGQGSTIDHVKQVLEDYEHVMNQEPEEHLEGRRKSDLPGTEKFNTEIGKITKSMAHNLDDFCSDGVYGKWFNGPSTFNISGDDFVVLELENLKPMRELFPIIVGMVVNGIKNDLYLSDRSRLTLAIFDEAWQFMADGGPIGMAIQEGYRRARKYEGAFWTITQSAMDLVNFGMTGEVINSQASYKFYLQSDDFEKAHKAGIIDVDPFTLKLMKSTKTKVPYYSEVFFKTETGSGHGRMIIDDYNYYLYTSSGKENAEMEAMVKSGMSWDEAISEMVRKYRS